MREEVIGILPRTRLYRIVRCDSVAVQPDVDETGDYVIVDGVVVRSACWRVWTATADFIYGTFIELHDDGSAYQVTVRRGEGDDIIQIK